MGLFQSKEQREESTKHNATTTKLDDTKEGIEEVINAVKSIPSHLQQDTSHNPKGSITLGYDPSLTKEENETKNASENKNKPFLGGRLGDLIVDKYPDETVNTGEPPSIR